MSSTRPSRPLLSVTLMLGATVAFVAMQAVVKMARDAGVGTPQVMFLRTAPGLPVLFWILRRRGEGLTPAEPGQVVMRSVLGTVAMGTNFASIAVLTLAQFSTLHLMQPVLVALLSPLVLRERIAPSTWTALALGVSGALVIVGPGVGSGAVPVVGVLLGLTSALASAFAQMWVRKATATDPPERMVFHFAALVALLSAGAAVAGFGHVPALPLRTWVMLSLGMAGMGTLGQVLMTYAYSQGRAAPVSVVAYAGIVLSLGADFLLFGVVPGLLAAGGALLVLGAGMALVRGR